MKELSNIDGLLVTIIAGANQGKSYITKQMIKSEKVNCFVYDVQNTYGATSNKKGDIIMNLPLNNEKNKDRRARFYGDEMKFIELARERKNTKIVFEEATAFFQGKTAKETIRLMIDRYHYQNTIIFQFHSINSVPPRILEMTDIFILFKTGDDKTTIKKKFEKLLKPFLMLKGKKDRSKLIIKNLEE